MANARAATVQNDREVLFIISDSIER